MTSSMSAMRSLNLAAMPGRATASVCTTRSGCGPMTTPALSTCRATMKKEIRSQPSPELEALIVWLNTAAMPEVDAGLAERVLGQSVRALRAIGEASVVLAEVTADPGDSSNWRTEVARRRTPPAAGYLTSRWPRSRCLSLACPPSSPWRGWSYERGG